MPEFDLGTYEGRQEARDAGYWVGDDGGGNVVAEYGYQGGQADQPISGGGGGGGGGAQPQLMQQRGGDQSAIAAFQAYLTAQGQAGADRYQLDLDRLELERQQLALNKQQAETDMQLARNADARAEAMLKIEQADLQLRQNAQARAAIEFDKRLEEDKRQAQMDEFLRQAQISGIINGQPTEAARQFNVNLGESQRQFDTNTYTGLANTLLQGAANLRGPRDWTQYAEFLGGGRNLTQQLFGGQPNAAFGAPSGLSPAIKVSDVMGNLGFLPGQNVPRPGGPQQVPLPHQINPAVWDRMGQSARDLALGMAQSGNTSAGVYTPEDYERIINATRPVGTAARVTRSQYAAPVGVM